MGLRRLKMAQPAGGGGLSTITFDPTRKDANCTLSNANKTVSTLTPGANSRARCTGPKTSGKWQAEFTVDAMGAYLSFGLQDRETLGNPVVAYPSTVSGNYLGGGTLGRHYAGSSFLTVGTPTPATAEVWGFTIDFATKEMVIYRNGVVRSTRTISVLDPVTYVYVPFVGLYAVDGSTAMLVSINESLVYPVGGFLPWTA